MEKISDELFTRFMDGEATPEETIAVLRAMREDKELMELYISSKRFDAMIAEEEEPSLPLKRMAAKSEDNLCDIICERFILGNRFPEYGSRSVLGEVKDEHQFLKEAKSFDETAWIEKNNKFFSTDLEKQWLSSNGVALYNVGRIMEGYGLSVTRHFYSSIEEIRHYLDLGESLIAIVNEEILEGKPSNGSNYPNHAVCILSLTETVVKLFNPSSENDSDEYPLNIFIKAWETSKYYLVAAGNPGEKVYDPRPFDLVDGVELDDELNDLLEALAENNHDVWAEQRIRDKWTYGPERNDKLKHHPDLRPYSELPDSEKEYDRKMAISTLKLAKLLGFKIIRPDSEDDYHCPNCGKRISLEMSYCPHCGRLLQLGDFIK